MEPGPPLDISDVTIYVQNTGVKVLEPANLTIHGILQVRGKQYTEQLK